MSCAKMADIKENCHGIYQPRPHRFESLAPASTLNVRAGEAALTASRWLETLETDAAVHANMARLSALSQGGIGGLTVEAMIRDLLRPMLKDWLDENLPSLVERMVEKEIARISRGVK